jgi:hypothetical protein
VGVVVGFLACGRGRGRAWAWVRAVGVGRVWAGKVRASCVVQASDGWQTAGVIGGKSAGVIAKCESAGVIAKCGRHYLVIVPTVQIGIRIYLWLI